MLKKYLFIGSEHKVTVVRPDGTEVTDLRAPSNIEESSEIGDGVSSEQGYK